MKCNSCGGQMHPETTIRLQRRLGGASAVRQSSWYCWDCRTSHANPGEAASQEQAAPRLAWRWQDALRLLSRRHVQGDDAGRHGSVRAAVFGRHPMMPGAACALGHPSGGRA